MTKKLYTDLCIIGGGTHGLALAEQAVRTGLDVTLVEKNAMGGARLNHAAIPSRALQEAGKVAETFDNADKFGIKPRTPEISFANVHKQIQQVIRRAAPLDSQHKYEGLGVKVLNETGVFTGTDTLQAGKTEITAAHFVIATGSQPAIPDIEGLQPDDILTPAGFFALSEAPEHLVVIGGEAAGLEIAQGCRRLGIPVTLVARGDILPGADREGAEIVRAALEKTGVQIVENCEIVKIMHDFEGEGGARVRIKKSGDFDVFKASHVLVADGYVADTAALDTGAAQVEMQGGAIRVSSTQQTSNPRIYALGSATGQNPGGESAAYQAGVILDRITGNRSPARPPPPMRIVYTDPVLAQAGMDATDAQQKYGAQTEIIKWNLKESRRLYTEKKPAEGLVKIIAGPGGKILGATVISPQADELISLWTLAIAQNLDLKALEDMSTGALTYARDNSCAAGARRPAGYPDAGKARFGGWFWKRAS